MRTSALMLAVLLLPHFAHAQEAPKPDDKVSFELTAEDWVTSKTARVTVGIEAAVSGTNSGSMRADMLKAVNSLGNADWRLTNFNRNQDQTGMERWSAIFEARLPETALSGLSDAAKKASKAGMQISVADINFGPTLDETEAVSANLRLQLYKKVADQLTALNSAMPGRNYRVAEVDFSNQGSGAMPIMFHSMMAKAAPNGAMMAAAPASEASNIEHSEKLRVLARVVLATAPTAAVAPAPTAPAPSDKH